MSIDCSYHRSFYCTMIHYSHHPSLLLLFSDPSLAPYVTPSTAPWSTARTIHCSSFCSLIHCFHHPSLPNPPLAKNIAPCTINRSSYCSLIITHRSFYSSLIHRSHHPSLLQLFADAQIVRSSPIQTQYIWRIKSRLTMIDRRYKYKSQIVSLSYVDTAYIYRLRH